MSAAVTPAPLAESTAPIQYLQAGHWRDSTSARRGDVWNPSTGKKIAAVPLCTADETAAVITAAHDAWFGWGEKPGGERARLLFRFRELMMKNFDKVAMTVTREHGKTLVEAKAGV